LSGWQRSGTPFQFIALCSVLYKLHAKLFMCDYRGWHRAGKNTTQELAFGRFQLLFSAGRLEEGP